MRGTTLRKGTRVRLTAGVARTMFNRKQGERLGTILCVGSDGLVTLRWDGLKGAERWTSRYLRRVREPRPAPEGA